MTEQWVLLWSQRQNAFHIEPLERMLSINRQAYTENKALDYIVLLIGEKELCHQTADLARRTLMSREFGEEPACHP